VVLWIGALSITRTEFGPGNGLMTPINPLINALKIAPVTADGNMSKWRIPSSDSAGSMLCLKEECYISLQPTRIQN
jgi:hypothetical protein